MPPRLQNGWKNRLPGATDNSAHPGYAIDVAFAPDCFYFLKPEFDASRAVARLPYRFDNGPVMQETLHFPGAHLPLDAPRKAALDRALENLHLAAGVSYYKAGVPRQIVHYSGGLPPPTAAFFNTFYRRGLAEFAYRNGISLPDPIGFPIAENNSATSYRLARAGNVVVPIGGGKDSVVSLERVRAQGFACRAISVGQSDLIDAVVAQSGVPHIRIERHISAELFKLNRQGALNGHVPITGILAFVLLVAAILYEFDTIVMANERSASSGNVSLPDGSEVNHQYSKSLGFEQAFRAYYQNHILSSVEYFSLLRSLSELAIAQDFSRHSEYFEVFSSCNRNFKLESEVDTSLWCCNCPKCRFVFLMLAPFVSREEMLTIFGKNMLDDATQQAGFDALIGQYGHKPFECVGEEKECLAAFCLLTGQADWRESYLVKQFSATVLPGIDAPDKLIHEVMTPSNDHSIPARFMALTDAAQRA